MAALGAALARAPLLRVRDPGRLVPDPPRAGRGPLLQGRLQPKHVRVLAPDPPAVHPLRARALGLAAREPRVRALAAGGAIVLHILVLFAPLPQSQDFYQY